MMFVLLFVFCSKMCIYCSAVIDRRFVIQRKTDQTFRRGL